MAQLFKSPGVIADPFQAQSAATFLDDIRAAIGVELTEQATPIVVANVGTIYAKDVAGIAELHFFDDAGNETQITSGGGVPGVGDLDAIADGAIHGRVLNTSLTANEVTKLTDAGGDDLTVALGGVDRVLTISANSAINQSVLTGSSPTFAGITIGALTGMLIGTAGVVSVGDLDDVADGATYGKVALTSLNAGGEVDILTDAGGDNLTIALGAANRVLTLGADVTLNQDLQTTDTPLFSTLETTNEVILNEIATPANVANKGKVYSKDFAGGTELCYLDDSGNEVQITTGGAVVGITNLDDLLDGATYGRVLNTSLSGNEVVRLTDAGGDDMSIALGGGDRVLSLGADVSIDQNLLQVSDVLFNSVTSTATMGVGTDLTVGRDCDITRDLTSLTLAVGGGYGATGFTADSAGNLTSDGDFWMEGTFYPAGIDLNGNDGFLKLNVTDVNATPYNIVATDCYLQCRRTATGVLTINFPSIATVGDGYVLIVNDSGCNCNTNNITLVRNGADTIDNVAGNYTMNVDKMSLTFVANATTSNWEIN